MSEPKKYLTATERVILGLVIFLSLLLIALAISAGAIAMFDIVTA